MVARARGGARVSGTAVLVSLLPSPAARRPSASAYRRLRTAGRRGRRRRHACCAAASLRWLRALGRAGSATRTPGEPSWHRRARRARAEARVLVRLDAARNRLNLHHSAAFGGMQRRNGGGGFIGGGNADAARRLLLSIFDGAVAGRGQGLRGGFGGSREGGRQGNMQRQRSGEWACVCGFATNRPHRQLCYACGRARDVTEQGGAAGAKANGGRPLASGGGQKGGKPFNVGEGSRKGWGPVGADGSRPLLGGRGRGALGGPAGNGTGKGNSVGPNWNGKGPSAMAAGGKAAGRADAGLGLGGKGAAKGRTGEGDKAAHMHGRDDGCSAGGKSAGNKGGSAWARPDPVVDSEGYELVQPRKIRVADGSGRGGGADGDAGPMGKGSDSTTPPTARRLWSDDSDDDDMDDDEADVDGDDWGDYDEPTQQTDPKQLRAEYEELAREARDMERRGTRGPALGTLRQARDEAERRWREAKPPAPLPRRLEWAEAKLRKSQAALTRERLELDRLDEEYEARRADQRRRIEDAESWYQWRKQQLEQVHQEAAGLAPEGRAGGPAEDGAARMSRRLRGQTLPEMQAILEELQEGTPLRERMALLVADLADAESQLGARTDQRGTAHYNLYGGDSQDEEWGEQHRECEVDEGGDQSDDRARDSTGAERTAGWRPEGPGRWSRAGNMQAQAGQRDAPKGRAPPPRDDGRGDDGGAAAEASGDGDTGGGGATTRADQVDDTGERAGKHRRRQTQAEVSEAARREDDARRAEELRRQIDEASAAQAQSFREGKGGFGSEAALSAAAQRFVLDVQRAQAQAGEMGIEPRAEDGRMLLELSPAELRQWVEEHLENGGMHD